MTATDYTAEIERVIAAASAQCHVQADEVTGGGRTQRHVDARKLTIAYCRKHYPAVTLDELAAVLNLTRARVCQAAKYSDDDALKKLGKTLVKPLTSA